MAVNPLAGVLGSTALNPDVRYELAIDNDGDLAEDIVYGVFASDDLPSNPTLPGIDGALDDIPFAGGQAVVLDRSDGLFLGFGAYPSPSARPRSSSLWVAAVISSWASGTIRSSSTSSRSSIR